MEEPEHCVRCKVKYTIEKIPNSESLKQWCVFKAWMDSITVALRLFFIFVLAVLLIRTVNKNWFTPDLELKPIPEEIKYSLYCIGSTVYVMIWFPFVIGKFLVNPDTIDETDYPKPPEDELVLIGAAFLAFHLGIAFAYNFKDKMKELRMTFLENVIDYKKT